MRTATLFTSHKCLFAARGRLREDRKLVPHTAGAAPRIAVLYTPLSVSSLRQAGRGPEARSHGCHARPAKRSGLQPYLKSELCTVTMWSPGARPAARGAEAEAARCRPRAAQRASAHPGRRAADGSAQGGKAGCRRLGALGLAGARPDGARRPCPPCRGRHPAHGVIPYPTQTLPYLTLPQKGCNEEIAPGWRSI